MEEFDFKRNTKRSLGWLVAAILLISKSRVVTENGKNFNSHKTNSLSNIPWNMLLDPNYMSHKKTSTSNQTFQPPHRISSYSSDASTQHPHHSYKVSKDPSNNFGHYATPPSSQFVPNFSPQSHLHSFSASESKPPRTEKHPYSVPYNQRPTVEKISFPTNSGLESKHHETFQSQTSRPMQKSKNPKKKQNIRKPEDYFDTGDDYMDNLYDDYDYALDKDRFSYKPPRKQSRPPYRHKNTGDPLGLLPSASDPDGFFSKAKDLLKGGSFGKPNYAGSSPDYYSQYPPGKHYEEPDHSYYTDDGYGNTGYPTKDYFGPSGYDYESPVGDKYGGAYPLPDKRKGTKYGPLAFALGLLPLGLLLASLVPTVVTIPVSTAVATGRRKKRSVRFKNPALDIISFYGLPALEDPTCLNRIFCEVVRDGRQESSSIVQKFYYKIAYLLDEKIADFVGMKELIVAVRKNECQHFTCNRKDTTNFTAKNNTIT